MSRDPHPFDLRAAAADDDLLDMLGGNATDRSEADAELARVLVAWRRDVDTEPIGELVDTDTALAAISAARRPAALRQVPGWVWLLLIFAASAALFALIESMTR